MPDTSERVLPRVSVIIPTYNRAAYLLQALQSIASQSLQPYEVIVVDDGSSDNTREVVQSYPSTLRYLRQDHRGVVAARNLGLEMAEGDLIAWLDSDDLWEPEFLSTIVSLLVDHPELDGVYCGWTHIDETGELLPTSRLRVVAPKLLFSALIESDFIMTPALVVFRKCYGEVGPFDSQFRICEDYDMWLRLARDFIILGIPDPLVRIRVHENSEIMRDRVAICEYRMALTRKHFGPREGNPGDWDEDKRRAYSFALWTCVLMHIEDGEWEEGWHGLEDAVSIWPALLKRLDVFYELACGDQPRGYRSRVDLMDIDNNGRELLRRLEILLDSAAPDLRRARNVAYGNAYLALAMLSDQAGRWTEARRYLLNAIVANPVLIASYSVVRRFVKLCSGQRLVSFVRKVCNAHTHNPQEIKL